MYTLDVVDRHAVVYEPKSAMDENWHEAEVKNAIRANASKSSHVVVLNDQGGNSISVENDALSPRCVRNPTNMNQLLPTTEGANEDL